MTESPNDLTLRIATFNVENLGKPSGHGATLSERLHLLRPQLLRLRADILCLQEVDSQRRTKGGKRRLKAMQELLAETPYEGFHQVATQSRSKGGVRDKHNLVILSRFPIAEHRQIHHDLVAPPSHRPVTIEPGHEDVCDIEWDRPFLYAAVPVDQERTLHVINLHLRAPRAAFVPGQKTDSRTWRSMSGWAEGFFLAAVKRVGQALEVRLFVDRLLDADADALIVVCGDFNANAYETPVRTIRGDEEDAGNPHLTMRTLVPLERSLADSRRFSVVHHGRPQMLDHLLVSRPLLAWYTDVEIHNEALGDELITSHAVRGSPESFHAPVVAEFLFGQSDDAASAEDRFTGCLIGQCVGDAVGFMVEGCPPAVCRAYADAILLDQRDDPVRKGPFALGQYSDDSQLARELMASYVASGRFDPADYARRIAALFAGGRVVGGGWATAQAAARLAAGVPWQQAGTPPPNAGNGSAMRAGPIGLMFFDEPDRLIAAATDQGRITHADRRCSAGAVAIAGAVALVLRKDALRPKAFLAQLAEWAGTVENSVGAVLNLLCEWIELPPEDVVDHVVAASQPDFSHVHEGISPFVTESVLWSLYAFLRTPDDYTCAIHTAIIAGGDVDTTAAMTGAIAGARNGFGAIPPALVERITDQGNWGANQLKVLAREVWRLKGDNGDTEP